MNYSNSPPSISYGLIRNEGQSRRYRSIYHVRNHVSSRARSIWNDSVRCYRSVVANVSNDRTAFIQCILSGDRRVSPGHRHPDILIVPNNNCTVASSHRTRPVTVRFLTTKYGTFILHCSITPSIFPATLLRTTRTIRHVHTRTSS